MIAIYTLTSPLHDEHAVAATTTEFLSSLGIDYDFKGGDFADYGTATLSLIYVRTGGTEGVFKTLLQQLRQQSSQPIFLLTSGKSNSLAASMEIMSYLHQQGLKGEILHGSPIHVKQRIADLLQLSTARQRLHGQRLGIIGQPSDWLISSHADPIAVQSKLGVDLIELEIQEVIEAFNNISLDDCTLDICPRTEPVPEVTSALPDARRLYHALLHIIKKHRLSAFTIRCFDLLTAVHNTGCLALAQLNAEGIVAGCEGDVPAALSMMMCHALLGFSGFQANPSVIDPDTGMMTLAHCTIPLNMVSSYELDTHFESGIGVGIRGYMPLGPVTVFKANGDLSLHFVAEGQLIGNKRSNDLCRTQLLIRLDDTDSSNYFLTHPIGNHHIVVTGHHGQLLDQWCNSL